MIATKYFYIYAFVCKIHLHIHIHTDIYFCVCKSNRMENMEKYLACVISNKVFIRKTILFEKSSNGTIRIKHDLYCLNVLIFLIGMFV